MGLLMAKCDDPDMGEDPGVAEVVRQLDQACREAGFFDVVSDFVSARSFGRAMVFPTPSLKRFLTHEVFELPYEEKLKIKMTPAAGYRDFVKISQGVPDMHGAIDCYREVRQGMYGELGKVMEGCNQWPVNPSDLKPIMEEYVSLCTELSRKIMRGIALALGRSPNEFEGQRAGDPFWALHILGYPGASKVKNLSGEWISAVPIPGTFVCNIGDMLKIWSNGLYDSTLHHIINSCSRHRVCVAYFYEPNFDVPVEPLDVCVGRTGGTRKFGRAFYGEHLVSKVQTNFVE
ncbi:hypothetical protein ACJRO7_034444 [Eucalyptus globulus]|uniref:Fe2OG dioxygenase domain-containing protein n=1 Tax=Eucalyptus globulus TaxID=34317 RepID=A0ABD3J391_EUCGL